MNRAKAMPRVSSGLLKRRSVWQNLRAQVRITKDVATTIAEMNASNRNYSEKRSAPCSLLMGDLL